MYFFFFFCATTNNETDFHLCVFLADYFDGLPQHKEFWMLLALQRIFQMQVKCLIVDYKVDPRLEVVIAIPFLLLFLIQKLPANSFPRGCISTENCWITVAWEGATAGNL